MQRLSATRVSATHIQFHTNFAIKKNAQPTFDVWYDMNIQRIYLQTSKVQDYPDKIPACITKQPLLPRKVLRYPPAAAHQLWQQRARGKRWG